MGGRSVQGRAATVIAGGDDRSGHLFVCLTAPAQFIARFRSWGIVDQRFPAVINIVATARKQFLRAVFFCALSSARVCADRQQIWRPGSQKGRNLLVRFGYSAFISEGWWRFFENWKLAFGGLDLCALREGVYGAITVAVYVLDQPRLPRSGPRVTSR